MLIHQCVLPANANFGILKGGFRFPIKKGYTVLVGENDSGKTSILQFVARTCMTNETLFGCDNTGYILTERDYVDPTTETQGGSLSQWNSAISQNIWANQGRPLSYANPETITNVLPKFFLTHHDFVEQVGRLNELWAEFEFPKLQIGSQQRLRFDEIEAVLHGSGLRSVFAILAALTDPSLKVILIDEPEKSLEARLQKRLRDMLIRESAKRPIIVSTHSHLFLNLEHPSQNLVVSNTGTGVKADPVQNEAELENIAFALLGNSTQDLFFPANFLVVEGAFDQAICEKAAKILGISHRQVKVLSSAGIDNAEGLVHAVENNLTSLLAAYSPYREKVCALIDGPNSRNESRVKEIQRALKDRCFKLPEDAIEKYVPAAVYERAGMIKEDLLTEFETLRSNPKTRESRKREISQKLAETILKDDLNGLDVIAKALERAKVLAT